MGFAASLTVIAGRVADAVRRRRLGRGVRTVLREATPADRRTVYHWLARSDVTPSMMGPPRFPDHTVPTWEDFCRDYRSFYFDGSRTRHGRCFIIQVDGRDIGVVCHNAVRDGMTDADIWLCAEAVCGRGFGSDALRLLADHLHRRMAVTRMAVAPSARNPRAIAAYVKAGFQAVPAASVSRFFGHAAMDYHDAVVLVKTRG